MAEKKRANDPADLDQSTRRMREIQSTLLPEETKMLSPQELAIRLAKQLVDTPDNRRQSMRVRAALAVSDLEDLVEELSDQETAIRTELQRVYAHQAATSLYLHNSARAERKRNRK